MPLSGVLQATSSSTVGDLAQAPEMSPFETCEKPLIFVSPMPVDLPTPGKSVSHFAEGAANAEFVPIPGFYSFPSMSLLLQSPCILD